MLIHMYRSVTRAALSAAFACAVLTPSASRAYEVCRARCAEADLACNAAAALCELKMRAYDVYMQQIDAGQPRYALPPVYRDILRAHYPSVDLAQVRFAFSDQQPPDNATTDCRYLYFNDAAYVATVRDAGPNEKWNWLLHELTHAEQCASGGRERYALRWWSELEAAVCNSNQTIDLAQTTEQLAVQLQELYVRVHAAMPMEQAADAKAEAVFAELRRCCVAPDGTPVRALP
jgi:hypothetical protein